MAKHAEQHDDLDTPAGAPEDLSQFPPEVVDVIQQLRAERDEAASGRLRALADFKNYQRRALDNEHRAA